MSARKYLDEVQTRADKATDGPWRRGRTLDTPATRGWSREKIDANDKWEGGIVFARFTEADQGRGREHVATTHSERHDDAAFIAAARTDVPKLAAMLRIALDALDRVAYGPGLHSNEAAAHLAEIDRRAGEER